jgi:hypothetical protein
VARDRAQSSASSSAGESAGGDADHFARLRKFMEARAAIERDERAPQQNNAIPESATAGGEGDKPKARRRNKNPAITIRGGRMEIRAYGVTEDQLERLGAVQLSTTLCFSFSSAFLTFAIGVWQDVVFSGDPTDPAQSWWEGLATGALAFSAILAALGAWQFIKGRTAIGSIKRNTIHE